ncbi:BMP family protein [Leptolyngbya sp. 7M]|uniref:BMP family lipoprotein n=1 Tax=Leptolyngbya sp. 7M TaxID=2812896 RepID=UPI001B8BD66E|nr:BMP family ABC transporter substrate-binding protein [Leptolyngbya sp. 7M]QYO65718.1 BMP family ABC transporter substrate-binding protein [Leptolyngbya sp. 7M]
MKKRLILIFAIVIFAISCGGNEVARDDCNIRVGIVFDIGGKNDRSFNAAAWEGVQRAERDLGICLYDIEPGNPTSIEPAMRAFAERNFDLVIGVGFAQGPIMQKVAMDYPDIKFAIIDGVIFEADGKTPRSNVASLVFREHEGSYLVGMIAASKSRTGVLGFLGGMDIPLIHRFKEGYEEGARAVNPNIRVVTNFVGVTDHAWNNPGKGKELALSQIEKGADVIFTAAGNSGLGAFDAAEQFGKNSQGEANRFVIGVDSNQNGVKPGYVLTSMVKRVDNAVYDVILEVLEKRFAGGFHVFGLDKDGVAYAMDEFNEPLVPKEVIEKAEAAKAKIITGEIKVTDAMAPKN